MTYSAEMRAPTFKTRQLLKTTEMHILRQIVGKTVRDRERSENLRRACKTENIVKWVKGRKVKWNGIEE